VTASQNFDSLRTDALLTHVYRGDQDAWREVYRRYRAFLLVAARGEAGLPFQDAEDLVQSGFLTAWNQIEKFENRGEGSFRAWLRQIVIHKNLDRLRRAARRAQQRTGWRQSSDWMESIPAEPGSNPEIRVADLDEQDRLIDTMVEVLDPDEQELIALVHFEGLSMARIAEIMEVPRSTLRRRHQVAISKITLGLSSRIGSGANPPAISDPS